MWFFVSHVADVFHAKAVDILFSARASKVRHFLASGPSNGIITSPVQKTNSVLQEWEFGSLFDAGIGLVLMSKTAVKGAWQPSTTRCSEEDPDVSVYSAASFGLSITSTPFKTLVWATQLATGAPVGGVMVELYRDPDSQMPHSTKHNDGEPFPHPSPPLTPRAPFATAMTDTDGIAEFQPAQAINEYDDQFTVAVTGQYNGTASQILMSDCFYAQKVNAKELNLRGDVLLGRTLYRAGEVIDLVILAAQRNAFGEDVPLPPDTHPKATVYWSSAEDTAGATTVAIARALHRYAPSSSAASMGKFSATISIPADVKPGVYDINVDVGDNGLYSTITIADPRSVENVKQRIQRTSEWEWERVRV